MIRRVAFALLIGGLMESGAFGQTAPPLIAKPANPPVSFHEPLPTDPAHPDYHASAHRSIMRHNPLPRRTSYQSNYPRDQAGESQSQGYTSPPRQNEGGFTTKGVGRVAEYYDNHTLDAPVDYHPSPVAHFDTGEGPTREEQIQSYQAGTQRYNSIQNKINAFGRPYGAMGAGFGYGLGLAGGGLYTFPN